MKILHTSDWHIGQVFKNFSRQKEHEMFFGWLKETIVSNNIELLLVSGDIFDVSNPSTTALRTYYDFLISLRDTDCKKIIITGGNHDGVSVLDAPKEILGILNIDIISGDNSTLEDKKNLIIEVEGRDGELECIVCAVPFLRDRVVRKSISKQSSVDIENRLKEGIREYYSETLQLAKNISSTAPIIAMGHLTVIGSSSSDSEREIYIGKLQSLGKDIFDGYDYVALGHLHRPQKVANHIRYSGSPIHLSFGEKNSDKKVLVVDTVDGKIDVQEIVVPRFRNLFHIKGSLESILNKLQNMPSYEFAPLVEITIEDEFMTALVLSSIYEIEGIEVLQINSSKSLAETTYQVESLDDITAVKVFETICEENDLLDSEELRLSVTDCFKEIEERVLNEDS